MGLSDAGSESFGSSQSNWLGMFDDVQLLLSAAQPAQVSGKLTRVTGMVVEARALKVPVGSICAIRKQTDGSTVEAEVVGFDNDRILLMPTTDISGMAPGDTVHALEPVVQAPNLHETVSPMRRHQDKSRRLPIGAGLLGRVVNAYGEPIDKRGPLKLVQALPIRSRPINAMQRATVRRPLITGVKAIDSMLAVGRGQRLGLFAPAGVGKSVLLGMMAANTKADVIVVAMVGERGREVREFIEQILGPTTCQRTTVVAAPADEPPLVKMQAASYAARVAEFYRDQGLHVLFIMDSLTRYAMAMRDVALSIGEPPATRGYPPSVFARLPEFLERAGNGPDNSGSITAFYTVLVEGDENHDPIGEAARSYLDGHIVLSRELAQSGHYPAIDIAASVSRVMPEITDPEHQHAARLLRQAWSRYQSSADLISIGAYVAGTDPLLDRTIAHWPQIQEFLCQPIDQSTPSDQMWLQNLLSLAAVLSGAGESDDLSESGGNSSGAEVEPEQSSS